MEETGQELLNIKVPLVGGMLLASAWMSLLYFQPVLWACGTGLAIVLLLGLFTTRFVLGVHSLRSALALAPPVGLCWLGFFYIIFWLLDV